MNNYDGDKKLLGICEKYFLKLIQINGLNYHIELLTLDRSINQRIEDLNTPLDFIIKALDQINNSKRLEGVLSYILKIGNIMNGGGLRGGAYGFKIDLLTKIVDVKSSQKDCTMMTFLVDCFYRQKEEQNSKNKSKNNDDDDITDKEKREFDAIQKITTTTIKIQPMKKKMMLMMKRRKKREILICCTSLMIYKKFCKLHELILNLFKPISCN